MVVNNAKETKTDDGQTDESQNLSVKVQEWKKEREKKDGGFDLKVNECFGAFSRQRLRE